MQNLILYNTFFIDDNLDVKKNISVLRFELKWELFTTKKLIDIIIVDNTKLHIIQINFYVQHWSNIVSIFF